MILMYKCPDIADVFGKNIALQIAFEMQKHIINTCNWCDRIGKDFENFNEYFNSSDFSLLDLYFDAYAFFDEPHYVAMLRKAGFDGAIHGGNGVTFGEAEFKVFGTNQVWLLDGAVIDYEKLAR